MGALRPAAQIRSVRLLKAMVTDATEKARQVWDTL